MDKKIALFKKMKQERLIAVIRADKMEDARNIIHAAVTGGIKLIEITMTTPGAIELVQEIKEHYQKSVYVGVGTVLNTESAQLAINAGSEFVVCPHLDEDIIKLCNLYQVTVIPGTTVLKDMVQALKWGCSIIKLFPANLLGAEAIKSFKGPMPHVNLMPTGGVNLENLNEWLDAGAVCVGIGSELSKKAVQTQDFSYVTKYAQQLVTKIVDWEMDKG
ncbi:bifunctional 4-hydroxy-2-oxoglutarate aldolase/2-dehydro-3-deoxy-phosphogluconate aldolase [Bacillus cereus]|uniref:bifunctional 4-hydroxy-2-oxoglutarate aldolase/2-dehydro-3-deoxy-phosphogluconate aldolase n=1 Tax=Bacillus cereus TaxID=1396 RepID=UPI0036726E6C